MFGVIDCDSQTLTDKKIMNLTYHLSKTITDETSWELVIKLEGLQEDYYSGFMNQENTMLSLVCPEDQIYDIENSFTPYVYKSFSEVQEAILLIESQKFDLINEYLVHYGVFCFQN